MEVKTSIVISSHLSDIQTGLLTANQLSNRINFIKWLIGRYPNLNDRINADSEWEAFTKMKFYKK